MLGFLQKKIFNSDLEVFGLDLSDLSLKIVQLESDGEKSNVASFGSQQLPLGCIADGEIRKKDVVTDAIKKLIASADPKKIKTNKVICSLPETKAFLRIISIPQMNADEIHEAVKWEMEANIPLPVDQVYYDWQILSNWVNEEKNKTSLLVVAIAKTVVDEIMFVLEAAGLEVVGLEIESIAQARSLLDERKNQQTALIIDIGDRRTSFSICLGGIPCFTSSIPLSGQSFTEAISRGMGVSFEEAEKIKFNYGIGSEYKNDSLLKMTQPILENLTQEIERSVDFYLTGLKYSKSIDKIIVCGGGANAKGIIPFLTEKMQREIEVGNPWINLQLDGKPAIDKVQWVQYSTAVGLALKGNYYEDLY